MLETNTVTPLLKRMETGGILTRTKGTSDARQTIVKLTEKGELLQKKLSDVPKTVGKAVMCDSITQKTIPSLFKMLDVMIAKLKLFTDNIYTIKRNEGCLSHSVNIKCHK